jgi:Family of unknown function (DUF6529)
VTTRPATIVVPLATGAATALALGVYSATHEPTGRNFILFGFESVEGWKSALASVTVFLFIVQLTLGLRITGRYGPRRPPPSWMPDVHRLIGTTAFALSLPVAFHCLWALGYQGDNVRILLHSVLGCVAYGLYAAKVVTVRRGDGPEWVVPLTGSVLGFSMLAIWWSTALVHYAGAT